MIDLFLIGTDCTYVWNLDNWERHSPTSKDSPPHIHTPTIYLYYTWEIQPMLYKCVRFYATGISVPMFQSVLKHRYANHSIVEYTRFIGSWFRYHLYNSVVGHVVCFPLFIQRYTTRDREEARGQNSAPLVRPCVRKTRDSPSNKT
jgi:hypothetical protein